jgi:tetratricopeptide (TPR) repeat protein
MAPKNRKPRTNKPPKQLYSDNTIVVEESKTNNSLPVNTISSNNLPFTANTTFSMALNTPVEIKNKNLCLNMIVKNESRVITRLLQSVVNYIDCYCICDTGSTDKTIEIIQDFFASQNPPIPGRIIQEPFRDFGYNRTFALKACEAFDVKYILLLDADMIFQVNPKFTKEKLWATMKDDAYYIFQGSDTFYYKNVRIVKNRLGMSYWGVTHEYVRTPDGTKYSKYEKSDVFINDIGDGGCKSDKFIRDIALLKKGLEDEPNNDRYTFYLANSYRDAGQYDNAIAAYKKRIEIGGWFDEVWHSHYSIGRCYKNMGDMANAIYWWMEAYNYFNNRIENLYEIIHHYRCNGKNHLAYGFYAMADHERKKNTHSDYLFLQKDVYDYKIDYELSIIGYYCNYNNYDLMKTCMKVINYPFVDENIARNVLSNYKFYTKEIYSKNMLSQQNIDVLKSIGNTIPELQSRLDEFNRSTPSICVNMDGDLVVNLRLVNYKINEQGGYENPGNISTINVIAIIDIEDEDWKITKEFILGYDTSYDNLYIGLEDIRLFTMENNTNVYFNANRGLSYHNITIEHGTIDMDKKETLSGFISMKGQREVEKNWVLFEDAYGKMKIIYNWSPLVIGDIVSDNTSTVTTRAMLPMNFEKTHQIKNPPFFKHLRGSTNGIRVGDEIWFICHTVSYEDRRYYYHTFVALDASTYEVKRFTPYFTFKKEKVEYTLGFVYFESTNEILIGFSLMDKETDYMMVDKSIIEEMMIIESML